MTTQVYRIDDENEYRKAGPTDLIALIPNAGANQLFLPKNKIETLVRSIFDKEYIHLSGPSGSAKSSVIEALAVPGNFLAVCKALGFSGVKPLKIYPVEMATFESPGELFFRRALKEGSTFDEKSPLVRALHMAEKEEEQYSVLIWLREMGRVHSSSIQGGLLNLMHKPAVIIPSGEKIDTRQIAWIADSNYQADTDSTHTLVTLDDALKRRFTCHITLDYLNGEQEIQILHEIMANRQSVVEQQELIPKIVKLGHIIRQQRLEGNLQSITPPTIYGFLAALNMADRLPHFSMQDIMSHTLLGNATLPDSKIAQTVYNEVFGLQADPEQESAVGGSWF